MVEQIELLTQAIERLTALTASLQHRIKDLDERIIVLEHDNKLDERGLLPPWFGPR